MFSAAFEPLFLSPPPFAVTAFRVFVEPPLSPLAAPEIEVIESERTHSDVGERARSLSFNPCLFPFIHRLWNLQPLLYL